MAQRGNELDRSALGRLPVDPGLCATCRHLRLLGSRRSVFVRCGLADRDPAFRRYPPLPVRACPGHEGYEGREGHEEGPDPDDKEAAGPDGVRRP